MYFIVDGTGSARRAKVTFDNRLLVDATGEPLSAERSRAGELFGVGTGSLSLGAGFTGPVLWLKNDDDSPEFIFVQKLIFGWNGGTTNHDRTVFSLISYQTTEPTAARTSITDQIENISRSGPTSSVASGQVTSWKWDGTGAVGMTGSAGGYAQIPNRLAIGNSSIPIDGEIILGPGDTMRFDATPEEAGLYNVSVVYYFAPEGGRSSI